MKPSLFDEDESDNEVTFKSSSEYAKKYNTLRRKEELLKLKNRLGSEAIQSNDSDSSEDDDDDDEVLSEGFDKNFFKTLSYLKKKDPKIYDNKVRFFDGSHVSEPSTSSKSKEKSMSIRDYNRKAILETGGKFSDDEDDNDLENGQSSPTYVQEQKEIKNMFSSVLQDDEDSGNEDGGIAGMFVKKKKTKEEEDEEDKKYHEWLTGEADNLKNGEEEKELKALKEYWSNPELDEGEAFLRDYFVNQRYKQHRNKDYIPSYDEIVNDDDNDISEDEKLVGQQTEFEHKFNFRFEEPDQDFIKRYPRTLEHSMRHKDNKRAQKRAEVKERKAEEKRRKKEDIAQLKSLKLKEIQEKIGKLKEITGNDQLAFKDEDIEGDFDPDEHDRRMRELFNEDYYGEEADDKKPTFPELDEELEIDDWDKWNADNIDSSQVCQDEGETHCEDENFNMDCDYDPTRSKDDTLSNQQSEAPEGRRRKRKRKNKLAEALARKKPVFDPEKMDKTFAEYLDEYYKLDCEDVIGDMPCRFKYREVPPCDYGLTTAEILMADDNELNRWYPLKKTLQYRPEHKQRNDQQACTSKARNLDLKRKILPSLFKSEENENEDSNAENNTEENSNNKKKNKRKKKKNKKKNANSESEVNEDVNGSKKSSGEEVKKESKGRQMEANVEGGSKKKKVKESLNQSAESAMEVSSKKRKKSKEGQDESKELKTDSKKKSKESQDEAIEQNMEMSSKKMKKSKIQEQADSNTPDVNISNGEVNSKSSKKGKKRPFEAEEVANNESPSKKKKKNKHFNVQPKHVDQPDKKNDALQSISDERLKAYGLNPKKYRNFMKYKKH